MKIYFFLLENQNSTTTYSDTLIANSLKEKGYDVEIIFDFSKKLDILKNPQCRAIFFQKTIQCGAHIAENIQHLKGKVNLIHIDDDFQDMNNKQHIDTLRVSDLILVGTQQHKEALLEYTSTPVETISCMLDFENYSFISTDQKSNNPPIISWQQACADAYIEDLLMISEPLKKIYNESAIQLKLFGWHKGKDYPDQSEKAKNILPFSEMIEYMPMERYIAEIVPELAKSDIFIMPYIDHKGRIGKSGFGLKRIMLLGIPVIAAPTQHHKTLIKHNINGYLASTPEQWYFYIKELMKNKKLRNQFSTNARKDMEQRFSKEAVIKDFIEKVNKHIKIFEDMS